MAPKVVVPADFGIENLHCEFHGNVVLKLQGGEEMRANSLILSYHSSVFVHLFLELHQSVLEMEDFGGEAVRRFLGALYSGEIELERNLFRDVNKLCHVFKVDWLSGRCGDYFTGLVSQVDLHTDYQTLLFLFEEARFCKRVMKCDKFLDIVVQKICGLENRAEIFVEPYMRNYTELDNSQLDLMIKITRKNPSCLLGLLKKNLEREGMAIDDCSRYILQNIDLCRCISKDKTLFEALIGMLESKNDLGGSDRYFVHEIYQKAKKSLKKKVSFEPSNDRSCSSTSNVSREGSPMVDSCHMCHKIPNVFCSFEPFRLMKFNNFLIAALSSSLITNVYMFIEGLERFDEASYDDELIKLMSAIRSKRGWSKIHPSYFTGRQSKLMSLLRSKGTDLISFNESYRRAGIRVKGANEFCLIKDLFFTPQTFAFYFRPDDSGKCNRSGKCGFIIKSTPSKRPDGSPTFDISVCLDKKMYPEGLHPHPELIQCDKIHLVPVYLHVPDNLKHCVGPFTWRENGIEYVEGIDGIVKLVAYISK